MVELSPVAPLELEAVLAGAVGEGLLVDVAYDGSIFVAAADGGNVVGVQYAYLKQQHLLQCATEFEHCQQYKSVHVTALRLVPVASMSSNFPEFACLAVGYNTGHVEIYVLTKNASFANDLLSAPILRQRVHNSAVKAIKARPPPTVPVVGSENNGEELYVVMEDNTIALFDGESLLTTLRAQFVTALRGAKESGRAAPSTTQISFRKFLISGQGNSSDIVTYRARTGRGSGEGSFLLSVGTDPFLSVYCSTRDNSNLVQLASDVASKLKSSIFSYAKSWWSSDDSSGAPVVEPPPKISPGTRLNSVNALQDSARKALWVVVDGTGRLAAMADALGRVMLVDLATLPPTLVRMWKGYREAQMAFFQSPLTPESGSGAVEASRRQYQLFLAIYAPRRGLLEVWEMRNGNRQAILNVGKNCRLVNVTSPMGKRLSTHTPSRCFLVVGEGVSVEEITVDMMQCGVGEADKEAFGDVIHLLNELKEHRGVQGCATGHGEDTFDVKRWQRRLLQQISTVEDSRFLSLALEQLLDLAAVTQTDGCPAVPLSLVRRCSKNILVRMTKLEKSIANAGAGAAGRRAVAAHATLYQDLPRLGRVDQLVATAAMLEKIHATDGLVSAVSCDSAPVVSLADLFTKEAAGLLENSLALSEQREDQEDQEDHSSGASRLSFDLSGFLYGFDNCTGTLHESRKHKASLGRQLFSPLLTVVWSGVEYRPNDEQEEDEEEEWEEIGVSGLFWEALHSLQLPLPQLMDVFIRWYFDLPLATLQRIPLWSSHTGDQKGSLSVFLFAVRDIYASSLSLALEAGEDPFADLSLACKDSPRLEHALVLSYFCVEQLQELASEKPSVASLCRSLVQSWASLRKNLISTLAARNWLYEEEVIVNPEADLLPLSVAALETTHSPYWLLARHCIVYSGTGGKDEPSVDECQLSHLFPHLFEGLFVPSLVSLHKVIQRLEPEATSLEVQDLLQESLRVEDTQLRRALLLKLWSVALVSRLSGLLSLLEKMKKSPNDRLLRRTAGCDAQEAVQLVHASVGVLQSLGRSLHEESTCVILTENAMLAIVADSSSWPGLSDSLIGEMSTIASTEGSGCSAQIVAATATLLLVLEAIIALRISGFQPLRLFPQNSGFFTSFKPSEESLFEPDDMVLNEREKFVKEVNMLDASRARQLAKRLGVFDRFTWPSAKEDLGLDCEESLPEDGEGQGPLGYESAVEGEKEAVEEEPEVEEPEVVRDHEESDCPPPEEDPSEDDEEPLLRDGHGHPSAAC